MRCILLYFSILRLWLCHPRRSQAVLSKLQDLLLLPTNQMASTLSWLSQCWFPRECCHWIDPNETVHSFKVPDSPFQWEALWNKSSGRVEINNQINNSNKMFRISSKYFLLLQNLPAEYLPEILLQFSSSIRWKRNENIEDMFLKNEMVGPVLNLGLVFLGGEQRKSSWDCSTG